MGEKDTSYKNIFTHPQMIEELLQSFVKEDWVKLIDFSTLEKCNGSYVTDDLRERIDDVIWKVKWNGKDLYLYILLELQSTPDYFMSVRIMTYIGLLYQDLIKSLNLTTGASLPFVLPFVLYNGSSKWTSPIKIEDIIQKQPKELSKFIPKVEYLLLDESSIEDSELDDLKNGIAILLKLERSQTLEDIIKASEQTAKYLKDTNQTRLRRAIGIWLRKVILPNITNEKNHLIEIEQLEEPTMLAETVKKWPIIWKEEGREEGIEQEKKRGIATQKATLTTILRSRFEVKDDQIFVEIEQINDLEILKDLTIQAALTDSITSFKKDLKSKQITPSPK